MRRAHPVRCARALCAARAPVPGLRHYAPGLRPQSPGCAHKDPDLRNTRRTQGRNQALVCDAVLPDSGPCVRHREGRAVTGHAPRPAGPEGGGRTDARYWHRRALFAPARVISPSRCQRPPRGVNDSLAMPTTPSRCQRLPRDADNPLAVSTTPSRCRQPPRGVNDPLTVSTTRVGAPRAFAPQPFRGRAEGGLAGHPQRLVLRGGAP